METTRSPLTSSCYVESTWSDHPFLFPCSTVGDRYPSANVIGLDLSPIQPLWVPPNVEFIVEDVEEDDWIHGTNFDYVHLRFIAISLRNPIKVAETVFRYASWCPGSDSPAVCVVSVRLT